MNQGQLITVDWTQQQAATQIFVRPAVCDSHAANWEGLVLEHHQQSQIETDVHISPQHFISLGVGANARDGIISERWLDGQYRKQFYPKGCLNLTPQGATHRYITREPSEFLVLALEPARLDGLALEQGGAATVELMPVVQESADPLIWSIGRALQTELAAGCQGGKLYVNQLTNALTAHLLTHYAVYPLRSPAQRGGLPPRTLQCVLDYIDAHLNENLGLADLAAVSGLSQFHFARQFKQATQFAPYQFVIQQRIERAKHLLAHSHWPITDIALQTGFNSQSHLTTHFRRLTGTTPHAFRAQL